MVTGSGRSAPPSRGSIPMSDALLAASQRGERGILYFLTGGTSLNLLARPFPK